MKKLKRRLKRRLMQSVSILLVSILAIVYSLQVSAQNITIGGNDVSTQSSEEAYDTDVDQDY